MQRPLQLLNPLSRHYQNWQSKGIDHFLRLFFSLMDEGIHFNKSNSLSLAFFSDLALLCLSSLPQEPKHSQSKAITYHANLFPELWLDHEPIWLSHTIPNSAYNKTHFPLPSPCLENVFPFPSYFPIPSNSTSIHSVKNENSRSTFDRSPSWPPTRY